MSKALQTTIRDLHRRRGRERRGLCLAEGIRLVEEVVRSGAEIRSVVVSPALETHERGRELRTALARHTEVFEATDAELTTLAATEHPQGILAVIVPPRWNLDQIPIDRRSVVVILDAVQDPGNVGTIARTAASLGAAGLVTLPGTAELTNPKTIRATMGAVFRLPAVATTPEAVAAWLVAKGVTAATAAADGKPLGRARLPRPLAVILGNEGQGAQSALARQSTHRVAIPLAEGADSLNVAVAAGIILHEVLRDR